MFDARLRQTKQRVFAPIVDVVASFPPLALTVIGLVLGLAAAVAAANGVWLLALILFIANRTIDGLDGEVARATAEASDEGGYADMVADTIVYAAIPIGAAAGSEIGHIWPFVAVLVASFYLNTTTWAYLSALIEKRGRGANQHATSIVMPPGLVEGAETVLFYTFMLAFPGWLDWTMGVMAAAVGAGAGLRFARGVRLLRGSDGVADRAGARQDSIEQGSVEQGSVERGRP